MADLGSELYLDMVKRSLLNETHIDMEALIGWLCFRLERAKTDPSAAIINPQQLYSFEEGEGGLRQIAYISEVMKDGRLPRPINHLMMGAKRLNNIHDCLNAVLNESVPGDVLEAGVWKGGGTIFMRAFFKAHGISDRIVWAADSFQGVPPPTVAADQGYDLSSGKLPFIAVSQSRVQTLFERYGLLDDQVRFLPGWFRDTLLGAPIEKLAILRLDGDLYESTMDTLEPLYDRVSSGGFIIVDDYKDIPPCKQAVDDFRALRGITDPIIEIDWAGVYWRKT